MKWRASIRQGWGSVYELEGRLCCLLKGEETL